MIEEGEKIEVINPVINLKKDLRKRKFGELSGIMEVFYPCWFFLLRNSLKRMGLRDRIVDIHLIIDGCGGHHLMLDGRPVFVERVVDTASIIENTITVEEAKEAAVNFDSRYIFRKFSVSYPIKKEFAEERYVFKVLYGLVPKNVIEENEIMFIDSITGDKTDMEIENETAQNLHKKRIIADDLDYIS
jgi:hypothetical protein